MPSGMLRRKCSATKSEDALAAVFETEGITGAELDQRELVEGEPLLCTFVERQDFHAVLSLLKNGANPSIKRRNEAEESALHIAVRAAAGMGRPSAMRGRGGGMATGMEGMGGFGRGSRAMPMLDFRNQQGDRHEVFFTALHMVMLLMNFGAALGTEDKEGRTALGLLAESIQAEAGEAPQAVLSAILQQDVVQLLIARDANAKCLAEVFGPEGPETFDLFQLVEVQVQEAKAAFQERHIKLLEAAESGDVAQAAEILQSPAPFILANDEDYDGNTALQFAVRHGQLQVGNCLLSHLGNPLHRQKGTGLTPVHTACMLIPAEEEKEGRLVLLEEMMVACSGQDLQSAAGQTSLQLACEKGFPEAGYLVHQARLSACKSPEAVDACTKQIQAEISAVDDQTDWIKTFSDASQQWEQKLAEQKAAKAAEEAASKRAKEISIKKEVMKKELLAKGYQKKEVTSALHAASSPDCSVEELVERIEEKRAEEKQKREERAEQRRVEEARVAAEAEAAEGAAAEWDGSWDGWYKNDQGEWVQGEAKVWCEHHGQACWDGCWCQCEDCAIDTCEHWGQDCPEGWCTCACSDCAAVVPQQASEDIVSEDRIWHMSSAQLEEARAERILHAQKLLCIDTALVAVLLGLYDWNVDRLVSEFFQHGMDELLKQCGIQAIPPEEMECTPEEWDCCPIGLVLECVGYREEEPTEPLSELYSMLTCGHELCVPCWKSYFTKMINENKTVVRCPMCAVIGDGIAPSAPEAMIKRMVDEATYSKYQRFTLKNFVEVAPLIKWCPARECTMAVDGSKATFVRNDAGKDNEGMGNCLAVTCGDGHTFCFWCGELGPEGHKPVSCKNMKDWTKRSSDEGGTATMTWLENNTKNCPKCANAIMKNGGCNHIKCGSGGPYDPVTTGGCGYHFCWACMEPMYKAPDGGPGTPRSGKGTHQSFFDCNKKAKALNLKGLSSKDKERVSLLRFTVCQRLHRYQLIAARYLACWTAWKEHDSDAKGLKAIEPQVIIEQSISPDKFAIVEDIQEAVKVQHKCREYLRNIEILLFYIDADSNEEAIWETRQALYKSILVSLSSYMTKPPLEIERADLKESLLLSKKVFKDFE